MATRGASRYVSYKFDPGEKWGQLAAELSKLVHNFAVEAANTANLAGVEAQATFLMNNGMAPEILLAVLRSVLGLQDDEVVLFEGETASVPFPRDKEA